MKKLVFLILTLLLICLLAACTPAPSSGASQSASVPPAPAAGSSASAVPVQPGAGPAQPAAPGTPAAPPVSGAAWPQPPSAELFNEMFRSTMFSFWVPRGYATTRDIPADENSAWNMWGLLTWTRQWADTGSMDENGKQEFTAEEVEAASLDVLGYVYDLSVRPGFNAGEAVSFLYGFGPGLDSRPVDGSYTEANGIITVDADIEEVTPGDGEVSAARWTLRYTFQYLPENHFPWQLQKTELVSGAYPDYF